MWRRVNIHLPLVSTHLHSFEMVLIELIRHMLLNNPEHLLPWLTFTLNKSIHTQSFNLVKSTGEHKEEADVKDTDSKLTLALRQSLQYCVLDRCAAEPLQAKSTQATEYSVDEMASYNV